jgi:soluble lytic murein transglycosylase-like protein
VEVRGALPEIRIFLAVGAVLSSIGLSACTSTGDSTHASLALESSADLALPDTVTVVPTSFEPNPDALAAFAEAPEPRVVATEAVFTPNAFAKADTPKGDIDGLIVKYAAVYEVPVDLVRRVVKRESTFNPLAYNRGHWGLMQIKHATARGMGYMGPAKGLLDAETNLKYAVKYLKGAWLVAAGNADLADRLYQRGYYYDAKRKGLLDETGLGKDRRRRMAPTI